LMYRCPRTAMNVDIWLADEVTPVNADTYEHVMCPSCPHIHFINKTTGKALGDKSKQAADPWTGDNVPISTA
jgi:hypothetical protein